VIFALGGDVCLPSIQLANGSHAWRFSLTDRHEPAVVISGRKDGLAGRSIARVGWFLIPNKRNNHTHFTVQAA
jgi:hypothetical protein